MSQLTLATSPVKLGWISACIGMGGADAYMLSMCRHFQNTVVTGIAVQDHANLRQVQWAHKSAGYNIPIHEAYGGVERYHTINYHADLGHAIWHACRDADIIVTWCVKNVGLSVSSFDKPVIELAQNADIFYQEVCQTNDEHVNYRVACSNWARTAFPEPDKVDVIYNAVDPARVTPRWGREITRRGWDLQDKKILLYAGRFVKEKNPQALVQALYELPEEWVAVIVGSGYLEDPLIDEALRWVGHDRIYFAPPQYQLGDLFAAADAFMLASDFEGLPLTVLEAWLAGVPTIVTKIPPILELRETYGDMSIYVESRCSPVELAEAVLASQRNQEAVALARAVVWNDFNISRSALLWENYLLQALNDWRQRKLRNIIRQPAELTPMNSSKVTVTQVRYV